MKRCGLFPSASRVCFGPLTTPQCVYALIFIFFHEWGDLFFLHHLPPKTPNTGPTLCGTCRERRRKEGTFPNGNNVSEIIILFSSSLCCLLRGVKVCFESFRTYVCVCLCEWKKWLVERYTKRADALAAKFSSAFWTAVFSSVCFTSGSHETTPRVNLF